MSEKKVLVFDKNKLVEYKGDFYTPEGLAEKLEVSGDVDIILHEDDNWFSRAMAYIGKENQQ